jgi:hypothetical protein
MIDPDDWTIGEDVVKLATYPSERCVRLRIRTMAGPL